MHSKPTHHLVLLTVALTTSIPAFLLAGQVTDTVHSPFAVVQPVRMDEVRWTTGFWAERSQTLRERSIPAMWAIMKGSDYKPYYEHFLIAAGRLEGEHHGAKWNDGDFYKWLEAACAVLAMQHDPELERVVEQCIEAIGAAQREDGYIHTPVLIRQRNGDTLAQPFQDRHNFEMYNMGHLMTAACIHYRVTGRNSFLRIAERTADFLCDAFRDPTPQLARNSVCPSHYMGIIELYRTTQTPRYLILAKTFLDMRNMLHIGDDNQDRIPFAQQREAVGHAVRANYLYAGAADLYLETGDPALRRPLEAIWENVVQKKLYINGACGALYDGASPDGAPNQGDITRVHQAYGRNYQLPNVTAHAETCANIGNLLWNWRMFLASGEARYIDVLELALYNSVLSGVSLDGSEYFYVNPLRNVDPLPTEIRWSRRRVPFVTSYCCPPNVVRTIAEVAGYAYSKSDDAIWINLFGSSHLSTDFAGEPLELVQQTNYPWDGQATITVNQCPAQEFAMMLRTPGWAEQASILVNNEPADECIIPGTYANLRRRWHAGDVVQLRLPMPARRIEAHPLVEETRNQIAVKRGPIVYCLESCELPDGVRVHEVVLDSDAKLRPRFEADLLGGVSVVVTKATARSAENWNGQLYRPLGDETKTEIPLSLIPYYAWANRGDSEMSVWISRQ